MRLQAMRLPDAIDGCRAHPLNAGQCTHAPMRRFRRLRVKGGVYNRLFFFPREAPLAPRSRRILQQPFYSGLPKTLAPTQHRRSTGAQFRRQAMVGHPVGRTQHNADAKHDFLRRVSRPGKTFQQLPLFPTETQRLGNAVASLRVGTSASCSRARQVHPPNASLVKYCQKDSTGFRYHQKNRENLRSHRFAWWRHCIQSQ